MWPKIGPIPTYGILYFVGIFSHFLCSATISQRLEVSRRVQVIVSICYLLGMTFGAKMLYDIRYSQFDLGALVSIEHYLAGGLWGGLGAYLALAVPAVFLLARRKRAALDLVALSIPIPWMFAKLGCLLNGCCHGRACGLPWAIAFPEAASGPPAGVPLHPTQIYEILVMMGILAVFKAVRNERWQGTKLFWFVTLYGFARAATDVFRGDVETYMYVGPITMTQFVCLWAAIVSVIILYLWKRKHVNLSPPHNC